MDERLSYIKENALDACPECPNPNRKQNEIHLANGPEDDTTVTCADCGLCWDATSPTEEKMKDAYEALKSAHQNATVITVTLKDNTTLKGSINSFPDGQTWHIVTIGGSHGVTTQTVEKSFQLSNVQKVERI
ncbi:MAG TPA: hypothetical protein VG347_16760 [Verrucomicrobiae bacterium]|nr:hypothetical protein [Verrucomicrobiae bacterium]